MVNRQDGRSGGCGGGQHEIPVGEAGREVEAGRSGRKGDPSLLAGLSKKVLGKLLMRKAMGKTSREGYGSGDSEKKGPPADPGTGGRGVRCFSERGAFPAKGGHA